MQVLDPVRECVKLYAANLDRTEEEILQKGASVKDILDKVQKLQKLISESHDLPQEGSIPADKAYDLSKKIQETNDKLALIPCLDEEDRITCPFEKLYDQHGNLKKTNFEVKDVEKALFKFESEVNGLSQKLQGNSQHEMQLANALYSLSNKFLELASNMLKRHDQFLQNISQRTGR